MSALPDNIVPFALPKRPRIREKDSPPDQRKVCVLPIRAVFDQNLTHGALQVLAAVCAYCNRAGITWVSQTRLAKELGISQQAVAKQFRQLRQHGYLETIRKGFKGERTDTLRVIFDPSIKAEDAIAITSAQEDTRPPAIRDEQMKGEVDKEGQRRIAQMIAKALKQPATKKEYQMPKSGQSRAVREIKEASAKALAKRTNHNPQVVNEEQVIHSSEAAQKSIHSQPNHNLEVVDNTENTGIESSKSINKHKVVQYNFTLSELGEMSAAGVSDAELADSLETLLPLFAAEGLTPSSRVLADAVLQLHRDAR